MSRRLVWSLTALIVVFMIGTLVVAIWQEDLGWGWWWAVPVGGGFVLAILGFRVLVQRAQEAERREDE
ncbi:hypothetical protein [Tessaracoccus caeni]|uniref:hypothetical protein n=1 Tax=Tessaracoccus caeni TaxID=3031239 RepID=UPI0023DC99A6|nr:hypothetical protein [Tessaracoccus caeni]MDF1487145.1 hypothetical protein [Tessaracoccus caeni]